MLIAVQQVIPWLIKYKYFIIFPVTVIEGPIITIVTGFLASIGYISLFIGYLVIIAGDLAGDSFYYLLGRFGSEGVFHKYAKYIGLNEVRIKTLKQHFINHPNRTFILGKIAHGAGPIILLAAGSIKVPFKKFFLANVLPTIVKSLILILVGYYFGKAYLAFNSVLNELALVVLGLFIIAYIIFIKKTSEKTLI
jgi:membrane protein DedA with SNARE-associated domain